MSPALYRYISEKWVDADANCLPGTWIMFDSTRRPNYDRGRQMYPDTLRFRQVLASIRDEHPEISEYNPHIPRDSRFGFSPDEIDDGNGYIAANVANILKLQPGEEGTTPPYAVFYYVGNLDHSLKLGDASTSEWFRNRFGRGRRLGGGGSGGGGLARVLSWRSDGRSDSIGFRLQVSFPSKA